MENPGPANLGDKNKALSLVPTPTSSTVVPRRRAGKEPMEDDRTEEELKPIIVNLAETRGLARARLIAVGVFLSSLLIPSR
jgi:hypothetical protein